LRAQRQIRCEQSVARAQEDQRWNNHDPAEVQGPECFAGGVVADAPSPFPQEEQRDDVVEVREHDEVVRGLSEREHGSARHHEQACQEQVSSSTQRPDQRQRQQAIGYDDLEAGGHSPSGDVE